MPTSIITFVFYRKYTGWWKQCLDEFFEKETKFFSYESCPTYIGASLYTSVFGNWINSKSAENDLQDHQKLCLEKQPRFMKSKKRQRKMLMEIVVENGAPISWMCRSWSKDLGDITLKGRRTTNFSEQVPIYASFFVLCELDELSCTGNDRKHGIEFLLDQLYVY